jgi:hypothetical protein
MGEGRIMCLYPDAGDEEWSEYTAMWPRVGGYGDVDEGQSANMFADDYGVPYQMDYGYMGGHSECFNILTSYVPGDTIVTIGTCEHLTVYVNGLVGQYFMEFKSADLFNLNVPLKRIQSNPVQYGLYIVDMRIDPWLTVDAPTGLALGPIICMAETRAEDFGYPMNYKNWTAISALASVTVCSPAIIPRYDCAQQIIGQTPFGVAADYTHITDARGNPGQFITRLDGTVGLAQTGFSGPMRDPAELLFLIYPGEYSTSTIYQSKGKNVSFLLQYWGVYQTSGVIYQENNPFRLVYINCMAQLHDSKMSSAL